MKRLIKKASKLLYHGTNYAGLIGMTESGFISPQASQGAGLGVNYDPEYNGPNDKRLEENFTGFVFLATNIDKAFSYTKSSNQSIQDELSAILEISLSENDLLPDDVDCPKCKTWQESESKVSQVKVGDSISIDNVGRVFLYNNKTQKLVVTTTIDSWQQDYEQNIDLFGDVELGNNSILEFLEEKGINAERISFANDEFGITAYNESLTRYSQAIQEYDSSIVNLYGVYDGDEIVISHNQQFLNTSHNMYTFTYDIGSNLVIMGESIPDEIDFSILKIVFNGCSIQYNGTQYYDVNDFYDAIY